MKGSMKEQSVGEERNLHTRVELLLVVFAVASLGATALGTPLRDEVSGGVVRWPNDTVIHVYIPTDPEGQERHTAIAEGVEAWETQPNLQTRGITIETHIGSPPAGATNAVTMTWTADQPGGHYGTGGPSWVTVGDTNTIDGGTIQIWQDTTEVNAQMARNLGIHEMGHVLGLDDVAVAGAAMYPAFTSADMVTISAADGKELEAVYAAGAAEAGALVSAAVSQIGAFYRYTYSIDWNWGGELGLFQVATAGSEVYDISVPGGWQVSRPINEDIILVRNGGQVETGGIAGYQAGDPMISFLLIDEVSYLGASSPHLEFALSSVVAPRSAHGFLNGPIETLGPIPEPSMATVLGGLTCAALLHRRRR